jgi:hypothetical protein
MISDLQNIYQILCIFANYARVLKFSKNKVINLYEGVNLII